MSIIQVPNFTFEVLAEINDNVVSVRDVVFNGPFMALHVALESGRCDSCREGPGAPALQLADSFLSLRSSLIALGQYRR